MFTLTFIFLAIRAIATVIAGQWFYTKFVRNYRASMGDVAESKNVEDEAEEDENAEE